MTVRRAAGLRVLVTGSAGFLGSHAVETLAAHGHTVYGLDAFTDTYDVAIKQANHELVAHRLLASLSSTSRPIPWKASSGEPTRPRHWGTPTRRRRTSGSSYCASSR